MGAITAPALFWVLLGLQAVFQEVIQSLLSLSTLASPSRRLRLVLCCRRSSKWQTTPQRRWTSCWQRRPRSCLDKPHPDGHTSTSSKAGLQHTPSLPGAGSLGPWAALGCSSSPPWIVLEGGGNSPHCSSSSWQQNWVN